MAAAAAGSRALPRRQDPGAPTVAAPGFGPSHDGDGIRAFLRWRRPDPVAPAGSRRSHGGGGHALSSSPSVGEERMRYSPQIVLDKNLSRSWIDNQRTSSTVELSQTSNSSSSSSSFSSLDGNRSTQQDLSSTDRMLFPERPFKCSPKLRSSFDSDNGLDYCPDDTHTKPTNMLLTRPSHPILGIRNLVKDSIYRDTRDILVRTFTKESVNDLSFNCEDPPTAPPPSSGNQERSKGIMDINESLRVLAKLREASWNSSESAQQPRLPYDAPRFSYDGRENISKLREVPRLSLDIKEGPLRNHESDLRSKPIMNTEDRSSTTDKEFNVAVLETHQEQPACKRLPSVVAKLMGLEELPEPNDTTSSQVSKSIQERKQEPMLCPLSLTSHDEPTPRQRRNLDAAARNVPKFPVKTAPWKQERIVLPRKLPKGSKGSLVKEQPAATVYSEIEKRLKELDFQQSNKDLRALKQILDSMQTKGLLQNKRREEVSMVKLYDANHSTKEETDVNLRMNYNTNPNQMPEADLSSSREVEGNAERSFRSPIVIMKPAKSSVLSGDVESSVIPLGGLSDLPQLRTSNSTDKKKSSQINRAAAEQHTKSSARVPAPQPLASDRRVNGRNEETNSKQKAGSQLATESSSRRQQLPRENKGNMLKNKNSTSPRLQQKRLDMERRARPPIPSPESNKNHRQSTDRSHLDTISPRGKVRMKPAQAQEAEDGHQFGVGSRTRSLNQQGNDMSARSEGSMSVASEMDAEVTSADRSLEVNISGIQQGSQTPLGRNPQKVKTTYDANKELPSTDPAVTIPERPSPVSVLDSSFDHEDFFCTSKVSNPPNVDDEQHPSEEFWKPSAMKPKNSKLAKVASLLQKLQQLSVNNKDDEAVDHIAFLCETQSPDHRYASEILLASGLLMKGLGSGQSGLSQIQLQASGYPINPDLFFVLEQRKSGCAQQIQSRSTARSDDPKRAHRRLIFDAVNELLLERFEKETAAMSSVAPGGQQLVKAVCLELEEMKAAGRWQEESSVIPDAEILRRLQGWAPASVMARLGGRELPGMVLEIERSIFKELVDEVVRGESADGLQAKAGGRRRRRLFA